MDNERVGLQTEQAAAIVVISTLVFLILIRYGFRGLSVGGASVSLS